MNKKDIFLWFVALLPWLLFAQNNNYTAVCLDCESTYNLDCDGCPINLRTTETIFSGLEIRRPDGSVVTRVYRPYSVVRVNTRYLLIQTRNDAETQVVYYSDIKKYNNTVITSLRQLTDSLSICGKYSFTNTDTSSISLQSTYVSNDSVFTVWLKPDGSTEAQLNYILEKDTSHNVIQSSFISNDSVFTTWETPEGNTFTELNYVIGTDTTYSTIQSNNVSNDSVFTVWQTPSGSTFTELNYIIPVDTSSNTIDSYRVSNDSVFTVWKSPTGIYFEELAYSTRTPKVTEALVTSQTPFTNPPLLPREGDEFFNTIDNLSWIFDGTDWLEVPDNNSQTLTILSQTVTSAGVPDTIAYQDENGGIVKYPVLGTGDAYDPDFFEVGTTNPPDAITDNIFTQGFLGVNMITTPQALSITGRIWLDDALTNVVIGKDAGSLTGSQNVALGNRASTGSTSVSRTTAVGYNALAANTVSNSTAVGCRALQANTTGSNNNAFGYSALSTNVTGAANSAFGTLALNVSTASNNSAFGSQALNLNTTGSGNTAIGALSMLNNTIGTDNAALGRQSLSGNTTGNNNTAFGTVSLRDNSTGAGNTAIGNSALLSNISGSNNIAIGLSAGTTMTSGDSNVLIGRLAGNAKTALTDVTVVGGSAYSATATQYSNIIVLGKNSEPLRSNETVIGRASVTHFRLPGNLPLYANTAAAAADATLFSGDLFRITNGDGTSAVHIKE